MYERFYSLLMLAAEQAPTSGPGAPASGQGSGGIANLIIPLVIIFGIMYLFIIGPQKKREKQRRAMLDALSKGDDIVSIGGIHGKIAQIKEQEIVVDIGGGNKLTFSRSAVARVDRGGQDKESGS